MFTRLRQCLPYSNNNYNSSSCTRFAAILLSQLCHKSSDHLDYSRYPTLNEAELEETFTRGSGPGGQAVNKTSNCVFLRHIPTNITIKCHTHRLASKNRVEARKLLLEKLDAQLNGELAVAAQLKVFEQKKSMERRRRQHKLQQMKKDWQEREHDGSSEEQK